MPLLFGRDAQRLGADPPRRSSPPKRTSCCAHSATTRPAACPTVRGPPCRAAPRCHPSCPALTPHVPRSAALRRQAGRAAGSPHAADSCCVQVCTRDAHTECPGRADAGFPRSTGDLESLAYGHGGPGMGHAYGHEVRSQCTSRVACLCLTLRPFPVATQQKYGGPSFQRYACVVPCTCTLLRRA